MSMAAPTWDARSAASRTALVAVSEPSVPTTMDLIIRRGRLVATRRSELDDGDDEADQDEHHDQQLRVEQQARHVAQIMRPQLAGVGRRSTPRAVTVVTGSPRPETLCGRSSRSQRLTLVGSV